MAEAKQESSKSFDPFESYRGLRDAYLDTMSKAMIETVNSEGYAQATGSILDLYLTAFAPFREAMEKSTLQAMQMLSVPSRQDVTNLAERLTHIEMRLDDMDAKLEQIIRQLGNARKVQGEEMSHREGRTARRS